jgi:hypothetical protein
LVQRWQEWKLIQRYPDQVPHRNHVLYINQYVIIYSLQLTLSIVYMLLNCEEEIMMNEENIPLYEVEELSLEDAILLMATEQEKYQTDYSATSDRIMHLVA